jgi:8-oxo-dGTP pyrophosphatase MutT (NUDIX family)
MHLMLQVLANNQVDLISEIRNIFAEDTVFQGENTLLGYPRASAIEARKLTPPPKESAVVFPIYQREGIWTTVFIQRPDGQGVHSNQLAFPGGKIEENESSKQAALRETFEEIGIPQSQIELAGQLTEIYIPPSHFVVQPFIGLLPENPYFNGNPDEVIELIEFPLTEFLKSDIIIEREVFIPKYNRTMVAKAFDVKGKILWGATAMMVQEFRSRFGYHT